MNQKFGSKIPGGLVTKPTAPGYEMVRVGGGGSQSNVPQNFVNPNQMGQLGSLGMGGPYGFPPNLASLAGFNPAAFLQPSKLQVVKYI